MPGGRCSEPVFSIHFYLPSALAHLHFPESLAAGVPDVLQVRPVSGRHGRCDLALRLFAVSCFNIKLL